MAKAMAKKPTRSAKPVPRETAAKKANAPKPTLPAAKEPTAVKSKATVKTVKASAKKTTPAVKKPMVKRAETTVKTVQPSPRLIEPGDPPTPARLGAFMGKEGRRRWQAVEAWIAEQYPGVFTPDWLYGGQKHGWSRRYKKGKSFCTLIPERGRCSLLIVLGKEEQRRAADIAGEWSSRTRKLMAEAAVYHDGQWLLFTLDDDGQFADATRLLTLKRTPKPKKTAKSTAK